jgi:hypothetical protein
MLLRRLLGLPVDDRPQLLAGIEALQRRGQRRMLHASSPGVIQPRVARACAPALERVATHLRDETSPLPDGPRRALRAFLTDGATSPLYGHDEWAALLAAEEIATDLTPARAQSRRAMRKK